MSRRTTRTATHIITAEAPRHAPPESGLALLRLLHLSSPALPIGAFHFSQGLECAVEAGWVRDEASALEWIEGLATAGLATLDLPVLKRLHRAWSAGDDGGVKSWNAFLIASRETHELRLEDRHLGSSLFRVLAELGHHSPLYPVSRRVDDVGVAYATAFSFACASWRIEASAALHAYAWAWAENQVLAAVKLVPLGQSAGQRMLHALVERIGALVPLSNEVRDSDIGISTTLAAIASALHETQYTRLFKS